MDGPPEDSWTLTPAMYRALVEHSSDIVTIIDADGVWRSSSPAGTRLLGWPAGWDPGPAGIFALLHPDDVPLAHAAYEEVLAGTRGPEDAVILRARASDGTWYSFEARARDLTHDPDVRGVVITARDVTERREAQAKLALLSGVLESSNEVVVLCDSASRVVYANAVARKVFGVSEGDRISDELTRLLDAESATRVTSDVVPAMQSSIAWTGELTARTALGDVVPYAVTIQLHPSEDRDEEYVSVIAHDISELKGTQAKLEHQATHDPLTGLPNRALFQELGDQALARANRRGTTVAVLFVDLDRFKPVNDSYGHTAGDDLLVDVATRLRTAVRRGDTVARFGGDEFVILCEHPAGVKEMQDLAERLIAAVAEPYPAVGNAVAVGASIGVAIGGGGRVTVDTLIRDADVALYRAKELGRGRAVIFGE